MATDQSTKKSIVPLYFIKEDPNGGDGRFTQIGIAVEHKDQKGWNLMFDVPIIITADTRLAIRERKEKPS